MEWININKEQLLNDYVGGMSLRTLARKYNTSKQTIKKKLLSIGATLRTSQGQLNLMSAAGILSPIKKTPNDNTLRKLCLKNDAIDISRMFNVNESCVTKAIRVAGINYAPATKLKGKIQAITERLRAYWDNSRILNDLYTKQLLSTAEIASAFNVDPETIRQKLEKYGVKRRNLVEANTLSATKPNAKLNRSATSKALHQDPNYRSKLSAALKLKWTDQEYRTKILSGLHNITISRQQFILYDMLHSLNIEHKPEYIIGPWTFDCLLPKHNILIECQGDYWHSLPEVILRDNKKANYVEKFHPHQRLVYFWEHAFKQPERIMKELEIIVGLSLPKVDFDLNNIKIEKIDQITARTLLEKYHYSGTCGNNNLRFGAFLDDQLIGVCNFGQITRLESINGLNVRAGEYTELTRFCIKPGYHKQNLASLVLSRSLKLAKLENKHLLVVITFADNTFGHSGTIYRATNFVETGTNPPSYWYVDIGGWSIHKKTVWDKAKARNMNEEDYASLCGYQKINGSSKTKFVFFYDEKLKYKFLNQNRTQCNAPI